MPKVDYDKQPFRLCRWNSKPHDNKPNYNKLDEYFCDYGEGYVSEDYCMRCFCDNWYQVCDRCGKQFLKTELKQVFEREIIAMSYVCGDCYDGEDLVKREQTQLERNIIYNINKWKKLNMET